MHAIKIAKVALDAAPFDKSVVVAAMGEKGVNPSMVTKTLNAMVGVGLLTEKKGCYTIPVAADKSVRAQRRSVSPDVPVVMPPGGIVALRKSDLSKALNTFTGVVEPRDFRPILQCVVLEAKDGVATVFGSNLKVSMTISLQGVAVGNGRVAVQLKLLKEALKGAKAKDIVTLSYVGRTGGAGDLAIDVNGKPLAKIQLSLVEEAPNLIKDAPLVAFDMPSEHLHRMLEVVEPCMAKDMCRPHLNGAYLHVVDDDGGKKLQAASTDGHKLAVCAAASFPSGAEEAPAKIIPALHVRKLLQFLKSAPELIQVEVGGRLTVKGGDSIFQSDFVEGKYPDYGMLIPTQKVAVFTADTGEFLETVKVAKAQNAAADATSKACVIELKGEEASMRGDVQGATGFAFECDITNMSGYLSFNADYLEVLKVLGARFRLSVTTDYSGEIDIKQPVLFTSEVSDSLVLIMQYRPSSI